MEKITKYFKFDYENDTTIEYVTTGAYSSMICSFTSEDPDYGTDTLHYNADPAISMGQMAYEYGGQLTRFLNKRDSGRYCDISREERILFDDYSNSTLYAVEKALKNLADEYRARSWFGHLEDVCREIARRMIRDGNRKFSFCPTNQEDWDQYSPEEYEQMGSEWYGIKRLDPIFDEESYEYLVAIGYYGGGCFSSAYAYDDGHNDDGSINELAREICNAIEKITSLKPQSIIFATEEEEK